MKIAGAPVKKKKDHSVNGLFKIMYVIFELIFIPKKLCGYGIAANGIGCAGII